MAESRKKQTVVLVSLNVPGHYSLALGYLKNYAYADKALAAATRIRIYEAEVPKHTLLSALKILMMRPKIVGFSCNIWNIRRSLKVSRCIKRICPSVTIVFGGQEVTNSGIDYISANPFIDILVDGEGEGPFRDVLRHLVLDDPETLDSVHGIRFRRGGAVVVNEPAEPIAELDSIPSPYLSGDVSIPSGSHLGMMLETARGCRYRCGFCFEGLRFKTVRSFSIQRVEEEIKNAVANGVNSFHILDPVLGNADSARLVEINRIINENIRPLGNYHLSVEVHAELITEEQTKLLSHFSVFDIGLQSVNRNALKNINRSVRWPRFIAGVNMLKRLKGQSNIYILLGLPGENFYEFLQSVKFARELQVPRLFINHLCILNGTDLRNKAEEMKIRYSSVPPYIVRGNATFTDSTVHLANLFSMSVMREHDALINRNLSAFWEEQYD